MITFTSTIITGKGKGRALGYPTINCEVPQDFALEHGVYGCTVTLPDKSDYVGALHYGPLKTFDDHGPMLEIHLLDFDGDLYGTLVTVNVADRVRDIHKYDSEDALKAAIEDDIEQIRSMHLL